jgi:hypothetical protein
LVIDPHDGLAVLKAKLYLSQVDFLVVFKGIFYLYIILQNFQNEEPGEWGEKNLLFFFVD